MRSSSFLPADLIRACLEAGDGDAWQEFIKRFHRLIAGVVLRTARQYEDVCVQLVDDLVQETYLKLCADQCRLLRGFEPRHPDAIYGFLKVVAANVVRDHFKGARSQKRGRAIVTTSVDSAELSQRGPAQPSAEDSLERNLLIQQVDACLSAITSGPTSARDRKIFWLYYRAGLSANAIAMLPSI